MDKRIIAGILVAVVVVALAAIVADRYFLPAGTVRLDQEAPEGDVVRGGQLRGRDGHSASGTVELVQDGDKWLLYFTDLQMTDGPDIYLYVTPSEAPTTAAQIDAGWRIPVVTEGDASPRINERGTFSVALPPMIDVDEIGGIGVWCERFSVPFATAAFVDST